MIKNIIVLGSSGQLGQEFTNHFSFNKSFKVNYFSKSECNISDYSNLENLIKIIDPCVVINCAAYTNVDKSETDKKIANIVNNLAVKNIAKLSKKYNFVLIHFSTDYVFNKFLGRPFLESDNKNPINYYGVTKHKGEENIIKYSKKFFIFRISWVYGIFGENFPKKIIKLTKELDSLKVVNDQIGVPTSTEFIVNFIESFILNFNSYQNSYGIYNLVPNGKSTWFDISEKILNKFINKDICLCKKIIPVKSKEFETIAQRPNYSLLDNNKLINTFDHQIYNWEVYFDKFLKKVRY